MSPRPSPYAGIIRIRFEGYDLRPRDRNHPTNVGRRMLRGTSVTRKGIRKLIDTNILGNRVRGVKMLPSGHGLPYIPVGMRP